MLRKKELMALPELLGNENEGVSARAEIVDIDGRQILHIDVSQFGHMIVRYFADRDAGRWICYGKHGRWNQMSLYSAVNYEISRGDYYGHDYYGHRLYSMQGEPAFDSSSALVEQYFEKMECCWHTGAKWMISEWEYDCRALKREQFMNNKMAKIGQIMDRVPALPEDFEVWLRNEVFPDDFLYVRRQGKKTEYICAACGKTGSRAMKAAVGGETTCPRCGKAVKVRSLNRSYKPLKADIVLMQTARLPRDRRDPLKHILPEHDVYIVRQLKAECRVTADGKELKIYEYLRAVVPKGENWGKVYYGECTDGGPNDQSFTDTNPVGRRWKTSYLYPNNLQEVLPAAGMEHSGLDILARKNVKINVNMFITTYHKRPWIEYLIKAGLYRLVQDISDNYVHDDCIKKTGRNLQECLMLDGAGVCRMKQLNGGVTMLEWLKVEKRTGMKVSKESIEYFEKKNLGPWTTGVDKMLKYFSPNRLANYIQKQEKETHRAACEVVNEWNDYMDMARKLKKQLGNEMIYKPRNVDLAHDECLALLKREDAGKRANEVRKKFPEAEINMQMMTDKYEFSDDTYQIIVPQSIEDIIVEGGTLGHCIDRTDVYFDRIQQRTSFLVFLRKTERPDAPWYTLEIEPGGTIRQKRTVGNTQRDEDIKAFTPFLREWQKHVLRKMNESDKALAKASREARLSEYADLRARKEPIRRGLLQGQLLADVLEADLMEAM